MRKVAVVTGASRGIGRAVAEFLARDYDLQLTARNQVGLLEAKHEIGLIHPDCQIAVKPLDLRDPGIVEHKIEKWISPLARVDLLFNNAGVFQSGTETIDFQSYVEMVSINQVAAFMFLKQVTPFMKAQRSGHIFNVSSIAGVKAFEKEGAYCSTKFALNGLNGALFLDLAGYNVKVTSICPSYVNTDMARDSGLDSERMIPVSDVVKTVEYALSLSARVGVERIVLPCYAELSESGEEHPHP
ncbi:SDR family oxidoreductase [Gemmatimonadota bacterium]